MNVFGWDLGIFIILSLSLTNDKEKFFIFFCFD